MKNKIYIIASMVLASAFSISARADRWIVKNPKQTINISKVRGLSSHSELQLENHYLILDMEDGNKMSSRELVNLFNAESAFEDVRIELDKTVDTRPAPEFRAWHVDQLEYDKLNPNYAGQGILVAVLDTGVQYTHKQLASKMWKNKKEIPNNGIDDDGNGFVDDYDGYNFDSNTPDPKDLIGHGTHCAGIIAATKDPASNAQGLAPKVRIMPLLIIGDNDMGFLSAAASAVKYATDNGAKVLSNSWRIYQSWEAYMNPEGLKLLDEAISYAESKDVILVMAAGNERKDMDKDNEADPIYPNSLPNHPLMISVAASSLSDVDGVQTEVMPIFSNYGVKTVSIAAPGKDIYSTLPGDKWGSKSGTSMAAPVVSGVLARGLSKGYNAKEALNEMYKTSTNKSYWQQYITHGRVDVKKYLE